MKNDLSVIFLSRFALTDPVTSASDLDNGFPSSMEGGIEFNPVPTKQIT